MKPVSPGFMVLHIYLSDATLEYVKLLFAKLTDKMLISGSTEDVEGFITLIGGLFPICKSILNDEIKFNECAIKQDEHDIFTVSMEAYMGEVSYIYITPDQKAPSGQVYT